MTVNKSGKAVKTKSGKLGRTFDEKGLVNGKVPVYLAVEPCDSHDNATYGEKAILCDPASLEVVGYID